MAGVALLFAGQGAQYPGMGRDLYDALPSVRDVFDQLEVQRPGTIRQCFASSKDELNVTINTQPCLFAVDYTIAKAVAQSGITVQAVAGFSLGEIPALAFAEILDVSQAFALVCRRAEVMQQAAEENPGGMMAVLKLSKERVEALCKKYADVFPVNYNSPEQIAVAGKTEELAAFAEDVKAAGGRTVSLAVSGAFHSPYMHSAAAQLAKYVQQITVREGICTVYANRTAKPYTVQSAREIIASQVDHPVQWVKTIQAMVHDGVEYFIEVGPGKTLSGLVKKIIPDAQVAKVENLADLAALQENKKLYQ